MGSLSFKENEMTIQLTRTPSEKAIMAFYAIGNHLEKVRNFQRILSDLERQQSHLNDLYNGVGIEDKTFGRKTMKSLHYDWNEIIDKYEDEIHNLLDAIKDCNKWLNTMANHVQFTNKYFNGDEYELKLWIKAVHKEYGHEVGRVM